MSSNEGSSSPAESDGAPGAAGPRALDEARLQAALNALRSDMEELSRFHVASQTAAAIAHELNQPLSALTSYTDAALMMLDSMPQAPAGLRRALEGGVVQAQRAGRVVRELLQFFRAAECPAQAFDLGQAIDRALAVAECDDPEGFHAKVDLAPALLPVLASRVPVETVLVNLVRNGIEAMRGAGPGPHAITISVKAAADGGFAQVTVQDSGPGLTEAAAGLVFKPFYTTKAKGIGLGLAISRALVEASGGRLWCEAAPGRSGIFHFTLPFESRQG